MIRIDLGTACAMIIIFIFLYTAHAIEQKQFIAHVKSTEQVKSSDTLDFYAYDAAGNRSSIFSAIVDSVLNDTTLTIHRIQERK